MVITSPMEHTHLSIFLHHFSTRLTELLKPTINNGLLPSLAATEPSVNNLAEGIDIATAAYVSELGYLDNGHF
jgi:phenylalanine ammonia-lyase